MVQTLTASALKTTHMPLLINGKVIQDASLDLLEVLYPADGQTVIGTCTLLKPEQLNDVLQAASDGFEKHRKTTATQRSEILRKLGHLLQENIEELSRIITLENGKPIKMARAEVSRAVTVCQGFANQMEWQEGKTYFIEGREAMVRHFPIGPVLAITPYNFPLNLVVHKLAPAIAAGNSITIKPASKTPLSALYLGRLAVEAGYDAISVIPSKSGLAEELVRSDVFKKLSFTGSSSVGWYLKSISGKKVVTLELGGNAGCIIDSLPDSMSAIATRCAQGSFWLSGQSCISVQRLFIKSDIYPQFLSEFSVATQNLKVGDPLDPETDIGPMVSNQDVQRIYQMIQDAIHQGAKVLVGGKPMNPHFMPPTILTNTTPNMAVNCEECFAPVVTVTPYETFEEALALVNDSDFGLQAGIYTTDRNQAKLAYETLDVGGVIINDVPTFRLDYLPYGGVKDSGLGREGVLTGLAEMSVIKTMIIKP